MNIINIILNNLLITIIFITFLIISYYYYMRRNIKHVVVFDLDETIGCFQQLGIFCDALEIFNKKKLTRDDFIEILDLYPEYFRLFRLKSYFLLCWRKYGKASGLSSANNIRRTSCWKSYLSSSQWLGE